MSNEAPIRLVDQYGLPILQDDRTDVPVIPHPLSFGSLLNTIAKTYSFRWDEALRHLPQNALAMRRDAFIKSLLQERKMPTINRSWQLKADNPKEPRQKQAVELLTCCIKKTRRWRRFLAYLMEAIWYGRYASQATWVHRPIGNGRRAWVIGKHKPVNGDKIQYAWDDTPVVFINQSGAGRYPPEFIVYTDRVPGLRLAKQNWRDQFIIHTHEVDDADYFEGEMAGAVHGVGLRNWIYWAWWLRDEMLSWAVDFMKKVGTLGLLVFWYELGNKTAKSEAELNAKRASKDVALVMGRPSGKESTTWGVDHFPAQYGGVEALQRLIQDYFEHHMERLIIGQTLSAGTEGGGLGGTGVAKLHEDTKFQLLQFDADNLAETLTDDLVGPMLRLNVPNADFGIRFEFNVESPDNADKMEAVGKAVSMGVTFKMDEVRELTGMSRPEEGEETIGGQRKGRGEDTEAGKRQHASQQDQSSEQVPYAKNPAFEAIHPRDVHGRFAEKGWEFGEEFTNADDPKEPLPTDSAEWKKEAAKLIDVRKLLSEEGAKIPMEAAIARNKLTTAAYADFASKKLLNPLQYMWVGAAAFASRDVGKAMQQMLDEYGDARREKSDVKMAFFKKAFDALADGNKAVFEDLYWQFLAFDKGGIDLMKKLKANGGIGEKQIEAWQKIADGLAALNLGKQEGLSLVLEGNQLLFEHEQKVVLQKAAFGPIHEQLAAAKALPILRVAGNIAQKKINDNAKSPFPPFTTFDDWAKGKKIAHPDLADADQRYQWGVQVFIQGYFDSMTDDDPAKNKKKLEARIDELKELAKKKE